MYDFLTISIIVKFEFIFLRYEIIGARDVISLETDIVVLEPKNRNLRKQELNGIIYSVSIRFRIQFSLFLF